ncbi:MAG: tRNA-(ms[2]io[6]A)-hydroxylase [Cellvibrionaceae bacterium]
MTDISHIQSFLLCETPQAWIDNAINDISLLLIDHANCEKKAASTALNIMYRYVDDYELLNKMSRLAREELRHFEQVIALMKKRGIEYPQIEAARYAGSLRKKLRTSEPGKLIDTLIAGAIIEARSCERFAKLAPYLDDELQAFYLSLLKSEARHYEDYLGLARKVAKSTKQDSAGVDKRVQELLEIEQSLILSEDEQFRFHSGPVAVKVPANNLSMG